MNVMVIHHFLEKDFNPEMIKDHLEYLKKLNATGHLVITGSFPDEKKGGMFVLEGKDMDELNQLVASDPAILNGIAEAEVRPYNIFLER